ncbi:MAG: hypothetical protein MJ066_03445 [Clostridia bacterium]|nr:hypothetical protein [Clostridia bacterium]
MKKTKEKYFEKSRWYRDLGTAFSIISFSSLVEGLILAILMPMRVGFYNGLINTVKMLIDEGLKQNYLFLGMWAVTILGTVVFIIFKSLKMLKPTIKKNGDYAVCFTAGMLALFYLASISVSKIFGITSFGYILGGILMMLPIALYLIYQYLGVFESRKLVKKNTGRPIVINIINLVVPILTVVAVLFFTKKLNEELNVQYFIDNVKDCLPFTIFYDDYIEFYHHPGIHAPHIFMKCFLNVMFIVELFRTFAAVLMNIFKFFFDDNYFYESKFFKRSSVMRSSARLAFLPFAYGVFYFIIDMYHKNGYKEAIKNVSLVNGIVFFVALTASIACMVLSIVRYKDVKAENKDKLYIGKIKK